MRLVNKLLDLCESSNMGPAADAGAALAHVFVFVRDAVFVNMDRRVRRCRQALHAPAGLTRCSLLLPRAQAHVQGRAREVGAD